jgi:mannose-6-phosphate isomerase-like protein (cupin superfamily)
MKTLSRRESLALAAPFALMGAAEPPGPENGLFALESDGVETVRVKALHQGKGEVAVRHFGFGGAAAPANFVAYDIPPGASEGVHVHGVGLPTGAYDEYYYVVAGSGTMQIDGRPVAVKAGDHVHAPMGMRHGIENTSAQDPLRVLLTFIARA